jgi:transcriptional regulator with XRE-family HTH domain
LPFCHAEVRSAKPKSERYPKELNTLGDHIRARRIDLGLFQSQAAEIIGVCSLTITNWEGNASSPPVQYIPAITRFLGYDPLVTGASFPERLTATRRARGLTQKQLARELGVGPTTIRDWENGRHEPSRKKLELIDAFLR